MSAASPSIDLTVPERGQINQYGTKGTSGFGQPWPTDKPRATVAGKVDISPTEEETLRFEQHASRAQQTIHFVPDKSRWARATVIKVEPESVTCNVLGVNRQWEIALPRVFFANQPIRYGTPIRIGVRDDDGYRTPIVEILSLAGTADPELEQLRAELLAL
jgi:hypothetical protein